MTSIKTLTKRVVKLAIGLLLFILVIKYSGYRISDLAQLMNQINPLALSMVFLLTIAIFQATALKWRTVLNSLAPEEALPMQKLFHYVAIGTTSEFFIPKNVGQALVRSVSLNKYHSIPITTGVFSVLVEQVMDITILLLLLPASVMVLFYQPNTEQIVIYAFLPFIISFFIATLKGNVFFEFILKFYYYVIETFKKIKSFFYRKTKRPDTKKYESIRFTSKFATKLYLLSVLRFTLIYLRAYFTVKALGINLSTLKLIFVISPASFFALLGGFIPGSLGVSEWGWYGCLTLAGEASFAATAFVTYQRILNITSCFLVLGISSIYVQIAKRNEGS